MDFTFSPEAPWTLEDLDARPLEEPPPADFDCGADEQNRFLQERAWRDHQKGISSTHMMYVNGIPAAYVTLMADRIKLSPKEKLKGISYELVPAVKIAQLAVARRFTGHGLGKFMIGYAVANARAVRAVPGVGCRYLTLDAQPHLVGWYERMGFKRNIEEQKIRQQLAIERNRALEDLAVSMRFDLRDLHDE
jgi:GNAT superfamily N-acetyltransferase